VTRAIELRIPNQRPYHGVARLVVGGVAARHNLSYDALEDLQLALDTVLEADGYAAGDELRVELEVGEDSLAVVVGPLHATVVRGDLESAGGEELGIGRLLSALVEDLSVEARDDGAWLRLAKHGHGVKPTEAHA
jgi:hypothetical protein